MSRKRKSHYIPQEALLKKRWFHFLAPRFWPAWLGLGFLRVLICLPYPLLLRIGHSLGHLYRIIAKERVQIAATNLKLCFPDLSEKERSILLKKNFASMGMGLIETRLAWWASDKRLRKMVEFQGLENLHAVQEKNTGMLVFTAHFTTIELALRFSAFQIPICTVYRPQRNPLLEWIIQQARQRYVMQSITSTDIKKVLSTLKNRQNIAYASVQNKRDKNPAFVPFFGIPTGTVTATSNILKHTGAALITSFCMYNKKQRKYIIIISSALNPLLKGEPLQDATILNQALENMIRQSPEQYVWAYKYFKIRPPGEPSLY
jgi:KDO2-lipid IV(A) lauroyltransferase